MVKYGQIDSQFHSLSDPIRRDILTRVSKKDLNLKKLAKSKKVSLPAISKHLKVLEEAKLIIRERIGKFHKFTLTDAAKFWLKQLENYKKFLEIKK